MGSIFNFQFGEFSHSTPSWFDWMSVCITVFASLTGYIVAYSVYSKQRKDTATDAHELFQDSLSILHTAVVETIKQLTEFRGGLMSPNDNFIQPILPVNLNDKFFLRIEITSLTRYYKYEKNSQLKSYKEFLKTSGYIGVYRDFFLNELNHFRSAFRSFEEKFQQHRLLSLNLFNEVISHNYGPYDKDFGDQYIQLLQRVKGNKSIIQDGLLINRDLLNDELVKKLANLSFQFFETDSKANEVNQLANTVNSAREDMNKLKKQMAGILQKNISKFQEILGVIEKLKD